MDAFIRDNQIIIRNFERSPERPIFDKIVKAFEAAKDINILRKIDGPSEDIVKAECNGGDIFLCYDIDYEICPIRCTDKNINAVFDIINNVIAEN